ncbi:MAG: TnpV protein [Clostridia bacterium]|nr:TnpV protein [Clostridia bacterium]
MTNDQTYVLGGDYYIPDLPLSDTESKLLGKYGRMREAYLKEHRTGHGNTAGIMGTAYEYYEEKNRKLQK